MAEAVKDLAVEIGERQACVQVGYSRATFQRQFEREPNATLSVLSEPTAAAEAIAEPTAAAESIAEPTVAATSSRQQWRYRARQIARAQTRNERTRKPSSLALTTVERQAVLNAVHEHRFIDRSVPHIYATLLDDGIRHCSMSTMYRILHSVGEVAERRDQATRPAHVKPELCATAPRQVFAWDITKLHGPQKWTYYYLYVIIDIYSRYVVGWMVADRESSELARMLLDETITKERIAPGTLTVHSDRGSSMKSKPVAFLLADLGVTKSHSRPHVSNDNPHIESFFKTTKYQPEFPATFANIVEARAFCRAFMAWYNNEHRHSTLALLTPADVHHGRASEKLQRRQRILDASYTAHPERFVHGKPKARQLPAASFINRPTESLENAA
jgi:transposase InsO family protein